MKLGSARRSGRLCGAVTAVVAALTLGTSVAWVAQTAAAVQSETAVAWVSPPPPKVLRPVLGDTTFTVRATAGAGLTWSGRGATCVMADGAAECRVRDRSRAGTLTFTATDSTGNALAASTQVVGDVSFASLGESFASGEANPPFVTDAYDTAANGCHRSASAGVRQIADRAATPVGGSTTFQHLACSGATIPQLSTGAKGEPGQLARLAQTPNVSLVTLSVGGNDIGVSAILSRCLPNQGCGAALAAARANLDRITTPDPAYGGISLLESTYREIRQAAPHARLAVTGYPLLFPTEDASRCAPLPQPVTAAINAVTSELNRRIELTTQRVEGATFVDLAGPFAGHAACERTPTRSWLTFVDQAHPVYSLHPNTRGQAEIRRALEYTLG